MNGPNKLSRERHTRDEPCRRVVFHTLVLIAAVAGITYGQQRNTDNKAGSSTRKTYERDARARFETDDGGSREVRFREGTELSDRRGRFSMTGDRITFYQTKPSAQFRSLENLALERVVRVMGDSNDPSKLEWSIDGMVTEYQGENYLMITRAVVASNSEISNAY